jgi:hypothetical protein
MGAEMRISIKMLSAATYLLISLFFTAHRSLAEEEDRPEQYRPDLKPTQRGSVIFHLPQSNIPDTVNYEVKNGFAVMEGDILLGRVDADGELIIKRLPDPDPPFNPQSDVGVRTGGLIAITGWQYRWPDGIIPFEIAAGFTVPMQMMINSAINAVNRATNITVRARRNGDRNFVRFVPGSTIQPECASRVGMQGGAQEITLTDLQCSTGAIQHEILHAAGAWHEHTRNDRDGFVSYVEANVNVTADQDPRHNFNRHTRDGVDIGPYDYGSIMHYKSTDFGAPNPAGGTLQPLIPVNGSGAYDRAGRTCVLLGVAAPTNAQVMGQRDCLSADDITGINRLYPFLESQTGGQGWGRDNYATSIAFGDIDGDNLDEVAIARRTNVNARIFLLDDATNRYAQLWSGGHNWGSGNYATSVAFGDVDGDGRAELGIARRANQNARIFIVDRAASGSFSVTSPGFTELWGSGNYATGIAFGNTDNDPQDEMVVTRKANQNARWFLFDDANAGYAQLATGGENWGGDNYATTVAFGDVDGDGGDEFAIGRRTGVNARYWVYRFDGTLRTLHTGGENWGADNYTTGVAFGDVDGDGRDEFGVVRRTGVNERYLIFDDINNGFRRILKGGAQWGDSNYATSIAFGDIDGDNRDEVAVARRSNINARYWVLDDAQGLFLQITSGGHKWGSSNYATSVAFGNINNDGRADLGLTRLARDNMRYAIFPSGN